MLAFVREHYQPGITKPELIRRMADVGVPWSREIAVKPDDPSESITVDMFRVPMAMARKWRGEAEPR